MKSISKLLSPHLIVAALLGAPLLTATPTRVEIKQETSGSFTLLRDGQPFVIRGAGGTSHLKDLVKYGGNSIRTWGTGSLDAKIDGKPLLDYCQELGIAVTVGIWIEHERHGFKYGDEAQLNKQRDTVRAAVRKFKDHPAILMWGLGNEMEGPESDGKDARIWKELNVLAGIVKEEDSAHPVMTVIAGAASSKVKGILEHYPNIDILGVNSYGGASGAVSACKQAGWKKPFVLTEFGPQGHWEVPKTAWGVPIEPSSRNKAASYYATMALLAENKDICLGSYVFLWGQKQEVTSTWYGMFLASGEKLPTVDAACYAWSGKWPSNRSPKITRFDSPFKEAPVPPDTSLDASVEATDAEGDTLKYEWSVREESTDRKSGGDAEAEPSSVQGSIVHQDGTKVTVKMPGKPGSYRLFVVVRDGMGGASADNIPVRVGG